MVGDGLWGVEGSGKPLPSTPTASERELVGEGAPLGDHSVAPLDGAHRRSRLRRFGAWPYDCSQFGTGTQAL